MQKASRPQRSAFRDKYLAAVSAAVLLLCSMSGQAQIIGNPPGTYGTPFHRGYFDSTLYIPTGCGAPSGISSLRSVGFGNGEKKRMAAIYADTCGHHVYWFNWTDSGWRRIDTGSGGGGAYTADETTLHLSGSQFSINNTYPGQASIATLGTVTSGIWNSTAIADAYIASAATWNAKLTSVLPSANIFVGNGSNIATAVAPSGDWSINNTGAATLASIITAGSCTNCNLTYDAKGRITVAANGTGGGGGNPFADNTPLVKNNADNTRQVTIDASGVTTGTIRTLTAPDANGTITLNSNIATLTNKTINASSNSISNIANSNLSGSAGITNANLATMPDSTVKGNLSGSTTTPSNLSTTQLTSMVRQFGLLKGAVPPAPNPTVDSILTQIGWAKVIKSSLFADSNARIGAGVLRPSSAAGHANPITWRWLSTSDGHDRYVFSTHIASDSGNGPTVFFKTAKAVVTLLICNDETLAGYGIIAGPSVFLDKALIQTWAPQTNNGGYLVGNGTSTLTANLNPGWTVSYVPGSGNVFVNNSGSLMDAQGYYGVGMRYSGLNNYHLKRLTSGLGSFNVGYQILDAGGNAITSNLTSSDIIDVQGNGAPIMTSIPASNSNAFTDVIYAGTFANYWLVFIASFDPADPDDPGTMTVSASGTAGQINLSWSAMARATNYIVQRSIVNKNQGFNTTVYTGSGTSFTDTGLTTGTTYYYTIRAVASGGQNNGIWDMNPNGTVAP